MNLACILIAFAIVGIYADELEQLVNGELAVINDYPHVVSIRIKNNYVCGGNIISKFHILTTANCSFLLVNPEVMKDVTIITGTATLDKGGQPHWIEKIIIHENYDQSLRDRRIKPTELPNKVYGNYGYDIGLIRLKKPIKLGTDQQTIKLPKKNIEKNEDVTIVSWGATGKKKRIHNELNKLQAKIILPKKCQASFKDEDTIIHPLEFCTFISVGKGTCNNDSGSGVIRKDGSENTLVGLVSGGKPCAVGYPDIFTNVFPFVSWIKEKMKIK